MLVYEDYVMWEMLTTNAYQRRVQGSVFMFHGKGIGGLHQECQGFRITLLTNIAHTVECEGSVGADVRAVT